jgi:hypothetical protein
VEEEDTAGPITAEVSATLPKIDVSAQGTVEQNGDPNAAARRAAAAGTRMPHLQGGVTEPAEVEVKPGTGDLRLEGFSPEIITTQNSGGRSLSPEELRQDIRNAFRGDKRAVLEWIGVSQDTTSALQAALDNARINDETAAAKVRELLVYQKMALDNIQQLVDAGATDEAAGACRALFARIARTFLGVMGERGLLRGIVASAALCALGLCGVSSPRALNMTAAAIIGMDKATLEALARSDEK